MSGQCSQIQCFPNSMIALNIPYNTNNILIVYPNGLLLLLAICRIWRKIISIITIIERITNTNKINNPISPKVNAPTHVIKRKVPIGVNKNLALKRDHCIYKLVSEYPIKLNTRKDSNIHIGTAKALANERL